MNDNVKIYFDVEREVITVTPNVQSTFPSRSLSVTFANNLLTVWLADATTRVVSKLHFLRLRDKDNQSFLTLQDAVEYLESEFSKPNTDFELLVNEGLI